MIHLGKHLTAAVLRQAGTDLAARVAELEPVVRVPRYHVPTVAELEQMASGVEPAAIRSALTSSIEQAGRGQERLALERVAVLINTIWPEPVSTSESQT